MAFTVRIDAAEETLVTALAGGADPATAWRRYAERHRETLAYYESVCGPPDAALTPADLGARAARLAPRITEQRAALQLAPMAERVGELLRLPHGSVLRAVTFVGWERATAWVDDERADSRAYFALERLPGTARGCAALAAHELTHLAHLELLPARRPPWSVGGGLLFEALAIHVVRELVPDATMQEQILLEDGVLEAYARHGAYARAELAKLLLHAHDDDEATFRRVFFPAWGREGDVAGVGECGYLVAAELSDHWRDRQVSAATAARMAFDEAVSDMHTVLTRC